MEMLFDRWKKLNLDTSPIGLCPGGQEHYFCTPIGAKIFAWDNGIHYCFVEGFGETVFCVNPETCCEHYVYPIARSFSDFLKLLMALKTANTIQQIVWMNKKEFEDFVNDPNELEYVRSVEVTHILEIIGELLGISPMEGAFEYVKELQKNFSYDQIKYSDEFYDITGMERYIEKTSGNE